MKALTAAEMREVDRLTTERYGISSTQLMENAGAAVAEITRREIARHLEFSAPRIIVLCGRGNNGGDGFVAARLLREEFRHTAVILIGSASDLRGDPALNFQRWQDVRGETIIVGDGEGWAKAFEKVRASHVILDALLGTGLRGAGSGLFAKAIEDLNLLSRNATAPAPAIILAVDTPSGLISEAQPAEEPILRAHLTVTFTAPKLGQLLAPQADACGSLLLRGIGSPDVLVEECGKDKIRWGGPEEFAQLPLIRRADSNKGLYGHILIIAGSVGKSGAAILAGCGALKAGAGLVTVATPETIQPVVSSAQAECMTEPLPTWADGSIAIESFDDAALNKIFAGKSVLAIGPGLGQAAGTRKFIRELVQNTELPTILDADGLNAFAGDGDSLRQRKSQHLAITPHPGEMGRLLGMSTAEVQKDRLQFATDAAKRWTVHILLKGFHTILASPNGEVFVNTTGNPGLAKGGTGDVLTGILAALTGQFGTEDWLRVLALGAWLHGRAADTLVEDTDSSGILASEVAHALPYARNELLKEIRRGA
jgi:NAD(P)H-hydrate epimerase